MLPSKKYGSEAWTVSGGQITVAPWIRATSRPIGTTRRVMGAASCSRRMRTTSISQPRPGANTSRVSTSASGTGSPHASGELSCQ
ncbi:MAG: hypothetical protein R2711_04525 [Acidimicrobiales bacterium]